MAENKKQNVTADGNAEITRERLLDLFDSDDDGVAVCVGSWKAYNECNEHALGSSLKTSDGKIHCYIDFMKLDGADELREVLKAIGWSDAEMEETFVQDYCSGWMDIRNCDNQSAFELADWVYEHRDEIDGNEKKLRAIIETCYGDYEDAMDALDEYDLYEGMDASDYARQLFEECYSMPKGMEWVEGYIDFDSMGRDMVLNGEIVEATDGLLVRC